MVITNRRCSNIYYRKENYRAAKEFPNLVQGLSGTQSLMGKVKVNNKLVAGFNVYLCGEG